jgi:beta-phosphoglucomutase
VAIRIWLLSAPPKFRHLKTLSGIIMDVDGVVLDSPHERAWREALVEYADPALLTTLIYQSQIAGKPRLQGALAALEHLGVPDAASRAPSYARRKQDRLEALILAGCVKAYPDALNFLSEINQRGLSVAAASSSKNAGKMMKAISVFPEKSIFDLFDVSVCGRDLTRGKPAPDIFLLAASELKIPASECIVVEDSPAGITAAKAAGMIALGVARHDDALLLRSAGADLVVVDLDEQAVLCFLNNTTTKRGHRGDL